jgi:hypothetical protein
MLVNIRFKIFSLDSYNNTNISIAKVIKIILINEIFIIIICIFLSDDNINYLFNIFN